MRTEQHYRRMLEENPNATINATLAASMVYAARHGICEAEDREDEWREILRRLMTRHGDNLTADEVGAEMDREGEQPLTVLAEHFGLQSDHLRRAAAEGRLHSRKAGSVWLSTIADVRAALDAGSLQRHPGRPPIR